MLFEKTDFRLRGNDGEICAEYGVKILSKNGAEVFLENGFENFLKSNTERL
jgi:hypothetical protein